MRPRWNATWALTQSRRPLSLLSNSRQSSQSRMVVPTVESNCTPTTLESFAGLSPQTEQTSGLFAAARLLLVAAACALLMRQTIPACPGVKYFTGSFGRPVLPQGFQVTTKNVVRVWLTTSFAAKLETMHIY